jgi:hypothetical protein
MLITRGLQEWACLLPQDLPFSTAARLLGWQTQEEGVLCASTLRNLVREHGQIVREAELSEAAESPCDEAQKPNLFPLPRDPRSRPGWPVELNTAVDEALIANDPTPPKGVSQADWERVLCARRAEATASVNALRQLGPAVSEGEVLATVDEVLTRSSGKQTFNELRIARITTPLSAPAVKSPNLRFKIPHA